MSLTGPQNLQLRNAITGAFDENALEQMMWHQMEVRLFDIAAKGTLVEIAFNLINWCDAQGRVEEFLNAIATTRPRNQAVQNEVNKLRMALGYLAPALSPPPPPLSAPPRNEPPTPLQVAGFDRLRTEAIKCLSGSQEAVQALVRQLGLERAPGADTSLVCEAVVDATIQNGEVGFFHTIRKAYGELKEKQLDLACKIIKESCRFFIPRIFQINEIRYFAASLGQNKLLLKLPVYYQTTIEIIMAGAHGQGIELLPASGSNVFPKGERFLITEPPETGIHSSEEHFINEFVKMLVEKFAPLYPKHNQKKLDKAIVDAIMLDFDWEARRYYYIYPPYDYTYVHFDIDNTVRLLNQRFPPIVFCRRSEPKDLDDEEYNFLLQLNRLLCEFAGIKWTRPTGQPPNVEYK